MSFKNYSVLPESSVVELLSSSGDGFHWNVNFVRPVQDWEVELVVNFFFFF